MRYALLAVLWCSVPSVAQYIPTPVDSWADVGTELHRISQRLSQQSLLAGGTTYGPLTSTGTLTANDLQLAVPLALSEGGSNKAITASNGAVVYSDADSMELSTVGNSGQYLKSNGAAAPTWATPGGSGLGDAILAATQTWTGANTYNSSSSFNGMASFLGTGTTTQVRISTAIEITGANLQDPIRLNGQVAPAFYAYKSSTQNIATSSRTGVNFEVELFDTNNNFSLTTERFIPTVAGTYQLSCAVFYNGALADQAQWSATIFKNETELCPVFGRTSGTESQGLGTSCALTANGSTDYFTCRTYQDSGDPEVLAASGNNFFSGARVW